MHSGLDRDSDMFGGSKGILKELRMLIVTFSIGKMYYTKEIIMNMEIAEIGNVHFWKYSHVEKCSFGNVLFWKCSLVEMSTRGNVHLWECAHNVNVYDNNHYDILYA